MGFQQRLRDIGPFVVSRYDIYRNTRIGDLQQRFKRSFDNGCMDPAPEKQIAAVNDQVHFAVKGRLQRCIVIGEKVRAAASFLYPGF